MNLMNKIEAILFVAGDIIDIKDIAKGLNVSSSEVKKQIAILSDEYDARDAGVKIVWMKDSVQMSTREQYANSIEDVLAPLKIASLSKSVIETLSIIAYRQPVTRTEVAELRGVRSDYSINILKDRGLIEEAGRKDTLGNPMMFRTTIMFLREFNIGSLEDLPKLEEMELEGNIETKET